MAICCPAPPATNLSQESEADSLERWVRHLPSGRSHLDLLVPEAHCADCIRRIEEAVQRVPGVTAARLNLSTRRLGVEWPEDAVAASNVLDAVTGAGYQATPLAPGATLPAGEDGTAATLLRALAVAGFAMANVMLLSVSVWSGADAATRDLFHWISALIALPALAYSGRPFFRSAWTALRAGGTNMDVPISIGILLACAMSLYETIHSGPHAYFDAAIALVFFLLTGRYLEHLMREKARSAVSRLLALNAKGATLVMEAGAHIYVPASEIRAGMRVHVAAGERIPADGIVEAGSTDIDRSSLTGEALPDPVGPGGRVQAGTLNLAAPVTMRVTAAGDDTLLAEIVRMMEAAEGGRARYVDLARRAARLYAPAVHTLAALTLAGWVWATGDWHQALLAATAVLIITCPCALGLAVPTVQIVASGVLFRGGILVKSGTALERLAEVERVTFDKTGTLTVGRPSLLPPAALDTGVLALAAGLARQSTHPFSRAITDYAELRGVNPADVTDVREQPGLGLEGDAAGRRIRLGSRRLCGTAGHAGSGGGLGEVWFAREGQSPVVFHFKDPARPDARAAIQALRERALPSEILSGDREGAVATLAKDVGVERWSSEWLPQDKASYLSVLADGGQRVLMVGDGINDAPALAAAHVSMAPSSAADVGQAAADIVFTGERLEAVVIARDVAVAARRLILQNFALAIGYNLVAVPVAMLGHATPLVAAIAMSTSSLIVMANALRLRALPVARRSRTLQRADAGSTGEPASRTRAEAA